MAEHYTNYRLYRTLTKLSGNMKYDIIVKPNGKNLEATGFNITPIIKNPHNQPVDDYIVNTTNQLNIKNFYNKNRSIFYDYANSPELMSDYPIILTKERFKKFKYLKTWDDQLFAGCQRMKYKQYGTSHEILVPVWLEKVNHSLRFDIHVGTQGFVETHSLIFLKDTPYNSRLGNFHKKLSNYLFKFFNDMGVTEGNDNVITTDLSNNITYISGINVDSGNIQVKKDLNLGSNLLKRERPLLESNSLITNTFPDKKMITTQLMNFNICFDIHDIISFFIQKAPRKNQEVLVWCDVYTDDELLEVRDIYTNHYFVPRETIYEGSSGNYYTFKSSYPENALDYLGDYKCTEIMHYNKVSQPICHWCINGDKALLFNLYDGFGTVYIDGDGNRHEFSHSQGSVQPDVTVYDPETKNAVWLGDPLIGDGDEVERILNHPESYIKKGILKDLSKSTGGYDLKYKDDGGNKTPSAIYMCMMTTPENMSYDELATAESMIMSNPEYIGILTKRLNYSGANDLANDRNNMSSDFDIDHDWFMYSDVDNRWAIRKTSDGYYSHNVIIRGSGGKNKGIYYGTAGPNFKLREHHNTAVLYICMRRWLNYNGGEGNSSKAPLIVVIWCPRWSKPIGTEGVIYDRMDPDALTFGGFSKAITTYCQIYSELWDTLNKDNSLDKSSLPNFEDLQVLGDTFKNFKYPKTFFFNKSVESDQDTTISNKAKEIKYQKTDDVNSYVYRYDGKIKPVFCENMSIVDESGLRFKQGTGRNFLWKKKLLPSLNLAPEISGYQFDEGFLKFLSTKIPPKYPSLDYDSVVPLNRYTPQPNKKTSPVYLGCDINYDYPLPKYLGLYDDGVGDANYTNINNYSESATLHRYSLSLQDNTRGFSWRWYEYKWFDKSVAKILEKEIEGIAEITSDNNDKETIEKEFVKLVQNNIESHEEGKVVDEYFVRDTYDYRAWFIEQEKAGVEPSGKPLYKYKYRIRAELK